jgi:hypothetical protein
MNCLDSRGRAARWIPPDGALGTALWLAGRRLSPMPITRPDDPLSPNPGKAPIGRGWGARQLSTQALVAIFHRHPGAGGTLEFRLGSNGKQVGAVCPPSPGADGLPRRWNGVWEITPGPEVLIEVVARMADSRIPEARSGRAPRPGGRRTR